MKHMPHPTMYKGYLGGHNWINNTDRGALEYLKKTLDIHTMIDVGCGPGGQVMEARDLGIDAVGIDGDERLKEVLPDLAVWDYTKGKWPMTHPVDLVWSTEFVEHVMPQYVDNFMPTFQLGKYVFMTFAPPGKSGNHHVNCQNAQYWIDVFSKYNLIYDEEMTNNVKAHSTMEREFVQNNGMFFYGKGIN
jgi:cyclopropane fatty-acyl-phospholipid synthase-like methyltransferase